MRWVASDAAARASMDIPASGSSLERNHRYTLSRAALERSISRLGDSRHMEPLAAKLRRGEPITIGQLGASVGQDGGCLAQPYRRCHQLSGKVHTQMTWGRPTHRRMKGYLVRFFEAVQDTWPHAPHQLNNSASDATPPQSALDCLFSHLPPSLDMVLLEFGSMARHIDFHAAEALLRMLLAMRPRPVVAFLTVREWCRADRALRFNAPQTPFGRDEKTPWARAEHTFDAWCDHYGVSCLSYFRAMAADATFYNSSGLWSMRDIGWDCLHPLKGRVGSEAMADILVHWLSDALAAAAHTAPPTPTAVPATAAAAAPWALPPPALTVGGKANAKWRARVLELQRSAGTGRCYSLLDGHNSPMVYQRLHPAT